MQDDREDDVIVPVTLDDATLARLQRRADAAGRTVERQIRYEMEVVLGLSVPDPGDREATQHAQLHRRIRQRRLLWG
jgi:tagatose-1,6-bisphosphate aldolase non-catalytic subunit AgaZ/GatZ